jgi:hypothetical protein
MNYEELIKNKIKELEEEKKNEETMKKEISKIKIKIKAKKTNLKFENMKQSIKNKEDILKKLVSQVEIIFYKKD